jgi:LPS-assembly lipoprotein
MSSPDFAASRRFVSLAIVGAAAVSLGGCLRPLYGSVAGQPALAEEMAAVEVPEVPERLGHYLRTELLFLLNGSGKDMPKRYRLTIAPTLTQSAAIIDTATTRADAATINASTSFALRTLDGSRTVYSGNAVASATYDRSVQRFATVRAARDAEIRVAKLLAEQIRTRVAAAFAAAGPQ